MPLQFRTDLTQEMVKELLAYDPLTGILTWRHRSRKWLPEPNSYILWNAAHAGQPAFTSQTADGSLRGKLLQPHLPRASGHLVMGHRRTTGTRTRSY